MVTAVIPLVPPLLLVSRFLYLYCIGSLSNLYCSLMCALVKMLMKQSQQFSVGMLRAQCCWQASHGGSRPYQTSKMQIDLEDVNICQIDNYIMGKNTLIGCINPIQHCLDISAAGSGDAASHLGRANSTKPDARLGYQAEYRADVFRAKSAGSICRQACLRRPGARLHNGSSVQGERSSELRDRLAASGWRV